MEFWGDIHVRTNGKKKIQIRTTKKISILYYLTSFDYILDKCILSLFHLSVLRKIYE